MPWASTLALGSANISSSLVPRSKLNVIFRKQPPRFKFVASVRIVAVSPSTCTSTGTATVFRGCRRRSRPRACAEFWSVEMGALLLRNRSYPSLIPVRFRRRCLRSLPRALSGVAGEIQQYPGVRARNRRATLPTPRLPLPSRKWAIEQGLSPGKFRQSMILRVSAMCSLLKEGEPEGSPLVSGNRRYAALPAAIL
jgi:hypothetical protein